MLVMNTLIHQLNADSMKHVGHRQTVRMVSDLKSHGAYCLV
jgi:hypothetical protein